MNNGINTEVSWSGWRHTFSKSRLGSLKLNLNRLADVHTAHARQRAMYKKTYDIPAPSEVFTFTSWTRSRYQALHWTILNLKSQGRPSFRTKEPRETNNGINTKVNSRWLRTHLSRPQGQEARKLNFSLPKDHTTHARQRASMYNRLHFGSR